MAGRHVVGLHLRTIEYMTEIEQRTALRCAHFLGLLVSVYVCVSVLVSVCVCLCLCVSLLVSMLACR